MAFKTITSILLSINLVLTAFLVVGQRKTTRWIGSFVAEGPRHTPENDREALRSFKFDLDREWDQDRRTIDKRIKELEASMREEIVEMQRIKIAIEDFAAAQEAKEEKPNL